MYVFERYVFSIFLSSFAIQKQSKWTHNTHSLTHAFAFICTYTDAHNPLTYSLCLYFITAHTFDSLVLKNIKWWCAHHKKPDLHLGCLLSSKIVCDIYSNKFIHCDFLLQFRNEKSGQSEGVVDKGKVKIEKWNTSGWLKRVYIVLCIVYVVPLCSLLHVEFIL